MIKNVIAGLEQRGKSSFINYQIRKLEQMQPRFRGKVLLTSGTTVEATHLDWALIEIPKSQMFINKSPMFKTDLIQPGNHEYASGKSITDIVRLEPDQLILKKGVATDVTLGRVTSRYYIRKDRETDDST